MNRREVFAAWDRRAGKGKLRLHFHYPGFAGGLMPGEDYDSMLEAQAQQSRLQTVYPAVTFTIVDDTGREVVIP